MQVYTLNNKEKRKGGGGGVGIKPTTKGTHFKMKPPEGRRKRKNIRYFILTKGKEVYKNKIK